MNETRSGPTLTRYSGQKIEIGDVVIEFVSIAGGRAKVKILAPENTSIFRGELSATQRQRLKGGARC